MVCVVRFCFWVSISLLCFYSYVLKLSSISVPLCSNIMVTMLNKAAFATVDFRYPYALSTIHMACNLVGAQMYFYFNRYGNVASDHVIHLLYLTVFPF